MALIIDFASSERKAFLRGVGKGMAAPFVLFAHHEGPAPQVPAPIQLPVRQRTIGEALRGDMQRVMGDFAAVYERRATQESAPAPDAD